MQPVRNSTRHESTILNPTQRMSVRIALATGATLVMLMGAQILALQDQSSGVTNSSDANGQLSANAANQAQVTATPTRISPTRPQSSINSAPVQPRPATRSSRRR